MKKSKRIVATFVLGWYFIAYNPTSGHDELGPYRDETDCNQKIEWTRALNPYTTTTICWYDPVRSR